MKSNKIPRAALTLACALAIGAAQTGCSLFVQKQQAVSIQSSDPSGQIFIDGNAMGVGSAAVTLDRTKSHTVMVKAPDGRSGAANINKHISTTGILDIVGGCIFLIPFIGVVGPGFWELDPDHVSVIVSYLDNAAHPPVTLTDKARAKRAAA